MIEGAVNAAYEAVVTLAMRGPAGQTREIEAVVDTGFNGFLTLPPVLVTELGLPFTSIGRATLADGSEATFDVYSVTVLWDGQPRYIEADAADTTPLVGMQLLRPPQPVPGNRRRRPRRHTGQSLAAYDRWGLNRVRFSYSSVTSQRKVRNSVRLGPTISDLLVIVRH